MNTTTTTTTTLPGIEPRTPAYAWGQRVVALDDLVNDGSYPDRPADALLAARGSVGEVVNIGHAADLNEPVYLVQFDGCVVGCLEIELVPVPLGWQPEIEDRV
jgi:nitrogen fixation protein NifZ